MSELSKYLQESATTFDKLLADMDGVLSEASSAKDIIGSVPGANVVIQELHKELGLSHDQTFTQIPKIQWSETKSMRARSYILVVGNTGVAAIIKPTAYKSNIAWRVIASTGRKMNPSNFVIPPRKAAIDEGEKFLTVRTADSNIALAFIKKAIGGIKAIYQGQDSGAADSKRNNRESNKIATTSDETVSPSSILRKFRPMFKKALVAAQADTKGMVMTMVKNDAYEKAGSKLNHLAKISEILNELDADPDNIPSTLNRNLTYALELTAGHYYPDQVDLNSEFRGYSTTSGSKQIIADIQAGDTKKLGTLLAYFKRGLVTGKLASY